MSCSEASYLTNLCIHILVHCIFVRQQHSQVNHCCEKDWYVCALDY